MCVCVCVCVRKSKPAFSPLGDMESDQWLWPVDGKQPVLIQSQNFPNTHSESRPTPSITHASIVHHAQYTLGEAASSNLTSFVKYINAIYCICINAH